MRNKFVKRMAVAFSVAAMTFTAATSIASASDADCFTSVKNEMSIYEEEELEETADIDPVYGLNWNNEIVWQLSEVASALDRGRWLRDDKKIVSIVGYGIDFHSLTYNVNVQVSLSGEMWSPEQ